jgi:hypothetical protein
MYQHSGLGMAQTFVCNISAYHEYNKSDRTVECNRIEKMLL